MAVVTKSNRGATFRFQPFKTAVPKMNMAQFIKEAGALEVTFANAAVVRLRTYPSQRPNQSYLRTGRTGAGWKVEGPYFSGNFLYTQFVNLTHDARGRNYLQFLYGPKPFQMEYHKGRWPLINGQRVFDQILFNRALRIVVGRAMGYKYL